ncbi:hypothetical protein [Patulibacter sp. SYSU D01012]|uniref:hypothetical protein n=1 Tax=Patulibacter sp. SYSU D01012 TaxID=2817381 RepID=UPI001B30CFD8|nr:hypothetical protein [Patulibacter sp. SYSU D01012]
MGPLPYSWQNVVLVAVQAALVALPGAGLPGWAGRFAGRAWSLVLPLSIAVVVAVLAVLPDAARALTWIALVAVPPLAAAALGWAAHGARAPLAVLAVPLLVVAVAREGDRPGQVAALALTALSCVALGRLLVGAVGGSAAAAARPGGRLRRLASAVPPLALVRVALVAMAVIDAVLVFSGGLEAPNRALNAAVPAAELPRLQFLGLGGASMGYGDVFVAGVLGALLAAEGASRRVQAAAAACTLVASLLFDLLFALDAVDVLPATVPVAVVLLAFGGWRGWRGGRARRTGADAAAARPTPAD